MGTLDRYRLVTAVSPTKVSGIAPGSDCGCNPRVLRLDGSTPYGTTEVSDRLQGSSSRL